jgi:hypothetical protein
MLLRLPSQARSRPRCRITLVRKIRQVRLALFARPAPPAYGLDWMSPAQRGLFRQVRQGGSELAPDLTEMAAAA